MPDKIFPSCHLVGLVVVGLVALPACSKLLEVGSLETEIRESVIRQGGLSLKTVTCPKDVPLEAGRAVDCVGELDSGELFAIPARQTDAPGKVEWDVPNTKGLLNLVKLETLFQETLQTNAGKSLTIECGQGYRSVKPGESFECQIKPSGSKQLTNRSTAQKSQSAKPEIKGKTARKPGSVQPAESILVTIDPENNVNWREVISVVSSQPTLKAGTDSSIPTALQRIASPARANLSEETAKDVEERFD